jgi:hypothetical protein
MKAKVPLVDSHLTWAKILLLRKIRQSSGGDRIKSKLLLVKSHLT